jgi:CRP/FNR family transcriptional regulator
MTMATSVTGDTHVVLWRSVPWLQNAPPEIVRALAAVAVRREYRAGEIVFLEQDPCAGLYLIELGTVKISRFSTEGREYILHLLHRGDTFNDVAALDGGPNPATATAYTTATLWRVDRVDLQAVASRYPALAWALIEDLARRARQLVDIVQDLSMRNVRGRLARLLLEQAQNQGEAEVNRLLTQEEMASQLGTVREMVGRILRGLAADGIIEFNRHRIIILDPDRLADEAEV